MCGRGIWVWIGSCWLAFTGTGQNLVLRDTVILSALANSRDSAYSLVRYRVTNSLGYSFSLTGSHFSRSDQGDENGQISLLHQLICRSEILFPKRFRISNTLAHDLGVVCYPDSLTFFRPDETSITTMAGWTLLKYCAVGVTTALTTRIFNQYLFQPDTAGGMKKMLSGALCSPLRWSFSAGTNWLIPEVGSLNIGISSARMTLITNEQIVRGQGLLFSTGVPAGKHHCLEYGITLQASIERRFLQFVQWNFDLSLFRKVDKTTDLSVKNLLGFRLGKHFSGSILTRILYEEEISRRLRFENLISAGFSLQK